MHVAELTEETSDGCARWRQAISSMFLENKLSANTTRDLIHCAHGAGARGAGDLMLAGAQGRQPGNTSRDFIRTILRSDCT